MIVYAPNMESSDFSKAKPVIHLPMLLSVLYAVGLFGFFKILRSPAMYGLLWDQGMALTFLSCGGIIGALLLILANRAAFAKPVKYKTLAIVATVCTASCGALFLFSAFALHSLALEMCALFLAGCGVPFTVLAWVIVYRSLAYRNVLLNSGLAYVLLSFFLFALTKLSVDRFYLICAISLFAGCVATLLFTNALAQNVSSATTGTADEDNPDEEASLRRFFTSVPFAGLILYAITTGLVFKGIPDPSYPLFVSVGVFLAILLVLALSFARYSQMPDHELMFYLYGFGLPAIAMIAIFIKMIPIDFVASVLFREFMKVYFQLILLAAWTYLIGCARIDSFNSLFVCAVSQIAVSLSFLTGNLISKAGSPINSTTIGLITAVFLLFAVITVGRNLISFARGPETAEDLARIPLDMEAVCAIVSSEYKLSPRETEVLRELAYGHSSSYVAKVLIISNNTARTHMKNIYKKLDINSREDLLELLRNKQKLDS